MKFSSLSCLSALISQPINLQFQSLIKIVIGLTFSNKDTSRDAFGCTPSFEDPELPFGSFVGHVLYSGYNTKPFCWTAFFGWDIYCLIIRPDIRQGDQWNRRIVYCNGGQILMGIVIRCHVHSSTTGILGCRTRITWQSCAIQWLVYKKTSSLNKSRANKVELFFGL